MSKYVISILLVVAMLCAIPYAGAENLDLSQMSTQELEDLRTRINVELKNRTKEVAPESGTIDRHSIYNKYMEWNDRYDFDSMLKDIDSGESRIEDDVAAEIRELIVRAQELMKAVVYDADAFTGEFKITSPSLKGFGEDCQVFPIIDQNDFSLVAGFKYSSALHYDTVFLKSGDDILERKKSSKKYGFDIQFETISGDSWEYSILAGPALTDGILDAISFRRDGSLQKEDYSLSDLEKEAVKALYDLSKAKYEIYSRMQTWDLLGR